MVNRIVIADLATHTIRICFPVCLPTSLTCACNYSAYAEVDSMIADLGDHYTRRLPAE